MNDGPHRCADADVDDREHDGARRNAKRIVHDGPNKQGRDSGSGDENGSQDARQQPGNDQRPRRKASQHQPPIGEVCLAGLEEHGEGGQKRGGPPGRRGFHSVAGAAQQVGRWACPGTPGATCVSRRKSCTHRGDKWIACSARSRGFESVINGGMRTHHAHVR